VAIQEDYLRKMSPTVYLIQGALSAAVLYPIAGSKAIIFGLSVVLIDIDHFIEYYTYIRRLDIKGMLKYHEWQLNNLEGRLWLNLFHHLFDEIQLIKLGKPFVRAFSVAEYFIRKKYYYTPLNEVGVRTGKNSS